MVDLESTVVQRTQYVLGSCWRIAAPEAPGPRRKGSYGEFGNTCESGLSGILHGAADQDIRKNLTPKERIRSRVRRTRYHAEANAMPSVAEVFVRIATVVMLIVLCIQAAHR